MSINPKVIKRDLDQLTADQLQQVGDFIAFLKYHDRRKSLDLNQLDELAEDDRAFAEVGMADYAFMLTQEDEQ